MLQTYKVLKQLVILRTELDQLLDESSRDVNGHIVVAALWMSQMRQGELFPAEYVLGLSKVPCGRSTWQIAILCSAQRIGRSFVSGEQLVALWGSYAACSNPAPNVQTAAKCLCRASSKCVALLL
jgi:hypothetical protein